MTRLADPSWFEAHRTDLFPLPGLATLATVFEGMCQPHPLLRPPRAIEAFFLPITLTPPASPEHEETQ